MFLNWIFSDPKHLWTQTFLGSNILLDSTSLWTQIILDPENSFQFEFFIDLFFYQIFSDPYFSLILKLLDPKGTIFFWLKLLWNKNFWDPKHLLTNYFWQNYHFNLICFYPISFSTHLEQDISVDSWTLTQVVIKDLTKLQQITR